MRREAEHPTLVSGSCFCGAVQFAITLPTRFCVHCHCTMCQRIHGAGYVTWVAVPSGQFHLTSGREHLQVYRSSEHGRRSFCGVCGSSLFCESTHHPDYIDVARANINAKIDRDPQAHYYFSDRAEWIVIGDDLPRFGGKTGTEPLQE